jgi:hypothetical protein
MTSQSSLFAKIFALWPTDIELASDMGVPRSRARQWMAREYVSPWYWPRLTDLAHQRFGRRFTYRQLVEATAAQRGPGARRDEVRTAEAA